MWFYFKTASPVSNPTVPWYPGPCAWHMIVTSICFLFSGLELSYPLWSTLPTTNQRSSLSEIYLLIFYPPPLVHKSFTPFPCQEEKLWAVISKLSRSSIIRSWPTSTTSSSKFLSWIFFFIKHCFPCLVPRALWMFLPLYMAGLKICPQLSFKKKIFTLHLGWLMGIMGVRGFFKGMGYDHSPPELVIYFVGF